MSHYTSNSFLRYKLRRLLFMAVKLAIVFGAGYFIYNKLLHNDSLQFDVFLTTLKNHEIITLQNGIFLLLLSALNWLLESVKWRILVSEIQKISFFKSVEQTFGSLTASVFTPNRIGEYGAKALYFKKGERKRILGFTLVGNLTQLTVTVVFGVLGFWFFMREFNPPISYYRITRFLAFGLLFVYFFFTNTKKSRFKIKGYSFENLKHFFSRFRNQTVVNVLLISALRYVVFSHQFYFLLMLFGVDISYFTAMIFISSMYLIVSIIPTIFILDVLIKGSVALWLFGFADVNEVVILSVILLMWLLNFAIPSILGSYFVLKFKLDNQ